MKIPKKTGYQKLWTGDFDRDGIPNIDDIKPFDKSNRRRVNKEVSLSEKWKDLKLRERAYKSDLPKLSKMIGAKSGRVKTSYSTIGKQMGRYIENIKDMGGLRILTNNKKENDKVLNNIKNRFNQCKNNEDKNCIFEVENKYPSVKNKSNLPYLGYHVGLRYKGLPYEVQIKCKNMQKIQDKVHPLYKAGKYNEANKKFRPHVMRLKRQGC